MWGCPEPRAAASGAQPPPSLPCHSPSSPSHGATRPGHGSGTWEQRAWHEAVSHEGCAVPPSPAVSPTPGCRPHPVAQRSAERPPRPPAAVLRGAFLPARGADGNIDFTGQQPPPQSSRRAGNTGKMLGSARFEPKPHPNWENMEILSEAELAGPARGRAGCWGAAKPSRWMHETLEPQGRSG